ncbi:hypothetical protein AB0M20_37345, partial [Actinoplanes sp. NPDC051633]
GWSAGTPDGQPQAPRPTVPPADVPHSFFPQADDRPPWSEDTPVRGTPRIMPGTGEFPVRRPAPQPVERRTNAAPQPIQGRTDVAPQPIQPRVEPTPVPRPITEKQLRIPGYAPSQPAPDERPQAGRTGEQPIVGPPSERPAPPVPVTAPIGRLVIAGPDTEPRRYVDENVQVDWFGPKGTSPDEKGSTGETTTAPDNPSDADKTGSTVDNGPRHSSDGVVIDMDISGLFDGRGVTAEQALIVEGQKHAAGSQPAETQTEAAAEEPTSPAPDAGDAQQELVAGGVPILAAQPDLAAAVPGKEPLSAADFDAIRWRLDGGTLREVVDDRAALRALGDRLDGPLADEQDDITKANLLSVRAEVYRLLGELGMAAAASRLALAHAMQSGEPRAVVIAQAELAHVLRLRGDFGEADRLFEEAASSETPEPLRSVVHENAGRSCFDQGRHMEALDHFARAVRLGPEDDMDLVERIGVSLEAVYIHVLRDGWGPYPRMRREIIEPEPTPEQAD